MSLKAVSNPENMFLIGHLAEAVRRFTGAGKTLAEAEYLRFVPFVLAPITANSIVSSSVDLHKKAPEKIDSALTIIADVGTVMDLAALTADALDTFEVVSTAAPWVDPLYIVGAILSTAGIALNAKSLYETHKFSKELTKEMRVTDIEKAALESLEKDNAENIEKTQKSIAVERNPATKARLVRVKSSLESEKDTQECQVKIKGVERAVKLIKHKHDTNYKFVSKHFLTDGNKLVERLDDISKYAARKLASPLPHKVEEGKKELEAVKHLENRLSYKKKSSALKIITAVISLIGFVILFTPAAPVGMVLLGLSGTLSVFYALYHRRVTRKFEEALEIR